MAADRDRGEGLMAYRIAPAGPDDAAVVHAITRAAFAEYDGTLQPPSGALDESVADVATTLASGGGIIVWHDGPPPAPVGVARFVLQPDHLYAGRLAVLPEHRGRGIAGAMMRHLEGIARVNGRDAVQIGVRMNLPRNLVLYERLGYDIVAVEAHPRDPAFRSATLVKRGLCAAD